MRLGLCHLSTSPAIQIPSSAQLTCSEHFHALAAQGLEKRWAQEHTDSEPQRQDRKLGSMVPVSTIPVQCSFLPLPSLFPPPQVMIIALFSENS